MFENLEYLLKDTIQARLDWANLHNVIWDFSVNEPIVHNLAK